MKNLQKNLIKKAAKDVLPFQNLAIAKKAKTESGINHVIIKRNQGKTIKKVILSPPTQDTVQDPDIQKKKNNFFDFHI